MEERGRICNREEKGGKRKGNKGIGREEWERDEEEERKGKYKVERREKEKAMRGRDRVTGEERKGKGNRGW